MQQLMPTTSANCISRLVTWHLHKNMEQQCVAFADRSGDGFIMAARILLMQMLYTRQEKTKLRKNCLLKLSRCRKRNYRNVLGSTL